MVKKKRKGGILVEFVKREYFNAQGKPIDFFTGNQVWRLGDLRTDTNDTAYYIDAALNPKNKLYKSIQKLRQRGRDD